MKGWRRMAAATLDGKLMFPSEYVAAVEFQGKDVTLTITKIEISELRMADNSTKKKPVLFFKETPKKLVLNKTNANAIADQLGSEARKWVGSRITLYPTTCSSFGKTVECIRIRPASKRTAARTATKVDRETGEETTPISDDEVARIADQEAADASPLRE